MEKDLKLFYFKKIKSKIKWIIQNNETMRNDLLMYLEICIEVCNLLEDKFKQNTGRDKDIFQQIQNCVLLNHYFEAYEFITIKEKELM